RRRGGAHAGARRAVKPAALAVLGLVALTTAASAGSFSHAALDTVLSRHVRNGRVDYGALRRDPGPLDRYLAAVADARPDAWSREEQIAFWVNVYDARVLDGVLRHPGIRSVLDVGKERGGSGVGFFAEPRLTAGAPRTLDQIEKDILCARFHEPRVHMVLNCASTSCSE